MYAFLTVVSVLSSLVLHNLALSAVALKMSPNPSGAGVAISAVTGAGTLQTDSVIEYTNGGPTLAVPNITFTVGPGDYKDHAEACYANVNNTTSSNVTLTPSPSVNITASISGDFWDAYTEASIALGGTESWLYQTGFTPDAPDYTSDTHAVSWTVSGLQPNHIIGLTGSWYLIADGG